jgi:hypothetical protein
MPLAARLIAGAGMADWRGFPGVAIRGFKDIPYDEESVLDDVDDNERVTRSSRCPDDVDCHNICI